MTVSELIAALEKLPGDAVVVIPERATCSGRCVKAAIPGPAKLEGGAYYFAMSPQPETVEIVALWS